MEILFKIKRKLKQYSPSDKFVELSRIRTYKKWIFDHLADYIISNLDYVGYKNECKHTKVNYHINQQGYRKRTNKIDVVYFTHFENYSKDCFTREEHFLWAAKTCDYCVCHAEKYAEYLKSHGVKNITVISPGIDFDLFKPTLNLSYVGKITPVTAARKGAELIEEIKKLPWVDLRISNGKVPREQLSEFYNYCDFNLITSRDEAGPMSLLEALACGKKVICPKGIGQVNEVLKNDKSKTNSILTYNTDKPHELFDILKQAYKQKLDRFRLVKKYSWKNFINSHDLLFKKILNLRD
jgi:glycosyltransferase involved in cell wall biosynthesis